MVQTLNKKGKQQKKAGRDKSQKKKKLDQFVAIFLLAALVVIWWFLLPKSSTIYFDGTAERATFSIALDRLANYGIKSDNQYNGSIIFGADETETIYVVEASMSEDKIQQIRENGFPGWESSDEVFPFIDGSATLSAISEANSESRLLMTLKLEPPEGESFVYDIEITRVKKDGDTEINQIELKNFSKEPVVKLSCTCNINMDGTTKMIPKGLYRIIGCQSITFFAVPGGPEDSESGYNPQLNRSLEHFQYMNTEKGTFEITYFAETEFSDVGHVEVEGHVQTGQWLMLEISDIGQYPIPVKMSGRAGELKMAGATRYPSLRQWLLNRSPDLLFLIVGAIGGTLFEKAKGRKEEG